MKNMNGTGSVRKDSTTNRLVGCIKVGTQRKTLRQRVGETEEAFYIRWNKLVEEALLVKIDNTQSLSGNNTYSILDIIIEYLNQEYKDGLISDSTYLRNRDVYRLMAKIFTNFINKPIYAVKVQDIQDGKEKLKDYSKSTIDKVWNLLTKAFKIATSRRYIAYNIMDGEIRKPISNKPKIKVEALSIKQEEKLKKILKEDDNICAKACLLQLLTGMRIGEVLARSFSDYDKINKTLVIYNTLTSDKDNKPTLSKHTKTFSRTQNVDKGKRVIPLGIEAIQLINELNKSLLKNSKNMIFWDYEKNTFLTRHKVNKYLEKLNRHHHITDTSLSSHKLRHTYITRLQEHHIALPVIQYLVGHVDGSTITEQVYTSVDLEFVKKELNNA